MTSQIPGGPTLPDFMDVNAEDLRYPSAQGLPELRQAIADYYNKYYRSDDFTDCDSLNSSKTSCSSSSRMQISPENVMIYPGGRPALMAVFGLLNSDVQIRCGSAEYAALGDILKGLNKEFHTVPCNKSNGFYPSNRQFFDDFEGHDESQRVLAYISNPHNPTGITKSGENLKEFVKLAECEKYGAFVDEAYELFHNDPASAVEYIDDIDKTNIFVTGSCTKGF